jgi:hypothetical protein
MSKGICSAESVYATSDCPKKRSQALRGRNLARDIRVSDAPKARQASGGNCRQKALHSHPLDIGVMPSKIQASKRHRCNHL